MTFAVRPIGLLKSAFVWRPTISSDVTNWVLYSQALAAGWDGVTPLDAIVTVASGIVLSANSTSVYGFDTGSGFPVGTSLKLIMPGYVCGMGGMGGNGAVGSPTAGSAGGPALCAQHAITIDATGGVIAGGGGGGGGAAGSAAGGGGGGRSGRTGPAGGSKYGTVGDSVAGSFSSGGAGGYGASGTGGGGVGGTTSTGGTGPAGDTIAGGGGGGGWGAAGGNGGRIGGGSGASGGPGGAAVVGNSYITWINTGTRYGAIT